MKSSNKNLVGLRELLPKSPTGMEGLDEILNGGIPKKRCTLICGGPGTGKTLFAMQYIINGALKYNEPAVLFTFEESPENVKLNMASLGFDLDDLINRKKLAVEFLAIERDEIQVAGDYNLEGLFIRLEHAINTVGAKRVVLDTIEALFSILTDPFILRSELRRLFRWLNDKGVTTIVTGEIGKDTLTRQGLEEYISDCVLLLENSVQDLTVTRRLRVVKYRGSAHEMNLFPFMISPDGVWVLPMVFGKLSQKALEARTSSGITELDNMLGGGYYSGSSVLISGMAGIGKSSFAASMADAACRRGERVLYLAFEETAEEIIRNMRSIGIDLEQWVKKGLLEFLISRTTDFGLEKHLLIITKASNRFKPQTAIIDSISAFNFGSNIYDVKRMMIRLVAFFKSKSITAFIINLISNDNSHEKMGVSSLIDTLIFLRYNETDKTRKRSIYISKSRGSAISDKIYEFKITAQGIKLYVFENENAVLNISEKRGASK